MSWEYSRSRAIVRASSRGVSVVTLNAGGSWRSSTAEKRYLEEGEVERVVEVADEVGWMGSVEVMSSKFGARDDLRNFSLWRSERYGTCLTSKIVRELQFFWIGTKGI